MKMRNGQAGIWTLISVGAGVVVSFFGLLATSGQSSEARVNDLRKENAAMMGNIGTSFSSDRERISALEEAVGTIKQDTAETKKDIKEILKLLK